MGVYCQLSTIAADKASRLLEEPDAESLDIDRMVSLDKGWHGLHYLLTGSADESAGPLAFLLNGGQPLGDAGDDDDCPPRMMLPAEVARLSAALDEVSEDAL